MNEANLVKNVTVIGAGHQGHAIAQGALLGDFDKVVLNSTSMASIEKGVERILYSQSYGIKLLEQKGFLKEGQNSHTLMKKLVLEDDLEKAVINADLVIECAYEKMEIKKKIFETLGKFSPQHAILATNTSTMSITRIARVSGREERVVGMHFLNPLGSRLVEITLGDNTSDETVKIAKSVIQKIICLNGRRKVVTLQKESPGFVVNRIVGTIELYFNWCIGEVIKYGIPFEELDADVIHFMPKGMCKMCDLMGIDTLYNSFKYLEENLSPDFKPCEIFQSLIKQGRLGKKVGKGFYDWSQGEPKIDRTKKARIVNSALIRAILLNEACKILEENIVSDPKEIDMAVYEGYNMPGPFSNGIKQYKNYSRLLSAFSKENGLKYLEPCQLLRTGEFLKRLNTKRANKIIELSL